MEVTFNNKSNVLSAQLLTSHDSSPIYTITTEHTIWGRTYTYLRDVNPLIGTPHLGSAGFNLIAQTSGSSGKIHGSGGGVGGVTGLVSAQSVEVQQYETGWGMSGRLSGGNGRKKKEGTIVGMINWKNKTIDVGGQKKKVGDVRKKVPGWVRKKSKTRLWRWAMDRDEYRLEHEDEGWKVTSTTTLATCGTFAVPYRPKLFGHTEPVVLKLSRHALLKDEVFLILALVYSEVKRGDKSNGSGTWGL